MLCVSIAEKNIQSVLDKIKTYEMAEIRIDALHNSSLEKIEEIFSSHKNLIATFRPNGKENVFRIDTLVKAIQSGAAYVDIELETEIKSIEKIFKIAKNNNCKLIISYHNFKETPSIETLENVVKKCFKLGAHIAKIAVTVNNKKDNSLINSLYTKFDNIVAIGMGNLGKISRLSSILCGAPFTFVCEGEKNTAPGQITYKNFNKILKLLENE